MVKAIYNIFFMNKCSERVKYFFQHDKIKVTASSYCVIFFCVCSKQLHNYMGKQELTSSISSLVKSQHWCAMSNGKYTTQVPDVVLYEFYEWCIFQWNTHACLYNRENGFFTLSEVIYSVNCKPDQKQLG